MNLAPDSARTCDVPAALEVHTLHAVGEHDLVNGTCDRENKKRKKDKVRNEETRAAGLKTI